MDENHAALIIQRAYKQLIYIRVCKAIFNIYKMYFPKLFPREQMRTLTSWEILAGFSKSKDSLTNFQQHLGNFWEEIMGAVSWYINLPTDGSHGGCDGISDSCFYEVKSRYNTMKGSMAFNEIEKKLRYAIENGKDFKLLVLIDKNNSSRDIPLHEGNALRRIRDIPEYNESRHRWISDKEVFNHIFGYNSDKIHDFISQLFRYTNPN